MGHNTLFDGNFIVDPPFSLVHSAYLAAFADTRRMQRDPVKAAAMPDPIRVAAGLPMGEEACFFVGGTGGKTWEDYDDAVTDGNRPPQGQPGLWCCWEPSNDRCHFTPHNDHNRNYMEWLEYVVETFLRPWGYVLRGEIKWQGDDPLDRGTIVASGNRIEVFSDELDEFEHLENVDRLLGQFQEFLELGVQEEVLHQFLKDSTQLLALTSSMDPISKFRLGSEYVTDFVIQEVPDGYVLVEIERPNIRLFNRPKKVGYPPERSRDFNHAIEQTEIWRAWVGRNHAYVNQQLPGISPTPLCWLIAGRSATLTTDEKQQLARYNEQQRHSLRVWTYDDFFERIETILRRMTGR